MSTRLIIDGNAVYEIDEDCLECQMRRNGLQQRKQGKEADADAAKNVETRRKPPPT